MMKFFRKHKKAVSPVIAVMLLVAVAVAAVGAYFIWFRSFQAQTQGAVQDEASGALGTQMQVLNMTNDGTNYYIVLRNATTKPVTVNSIKVGTDENTTPVSVNITAGNSQTLLYSNTNVDPTRGTTRTFTVSYIIDPGTNQSTGALVHTYTDA